MWPVIPPPYSGFSFRTFFQYDGPSLMDGVDPEHNVHDNLSDVWSSDSEIEMVEALADAFVTGHPTASMMFMRAGGAPVIVATALDADLLLWMGEMFKRIYTPALMEDSFSGGVVFPLFRIIKLQLQSLGQLMRE